MCTARVIAVAFVAFLLASNAHAQSPVFGNPPMTSTPVTPVDQKQAPKSDTPAPAATPAATPAAPANPTTPPAATLATKEEIAALEQRLQDLKSKAADLPTAEQMAKMSEQFSALAKQIEELTTLTTRISGVTAEQFAELKSKVDGLTAPTPTTGATVDQFNDLVRQFNEVKSQISALSTPTSGVSREEMDNIKTAIRGLEQNVTKLIAASTTSGVSKEEFDTTIAKLSETISGIRGLVFGVGRLVEARATKEAFDKLVAQVAELEKRNTIPAAPAATRQEFDTLKETVEIQARHIQNLATSNLGLSRRLDEIQAAIAKINLKPITDRLDAIEAKLAEPKEEPEKNGETPEEDPKTPKAKEPAPPTQAAPKLPKGFRFIN